LLIGGKNPGVHENINQNIIKSCQHRIREQTYDTILQMVLQMTKIYQDDKSFPEYGFYDKEKFKKFLTNMAIALGLENIQEIQSILSISQEIERLQKLIKTNPTSTELTKALEIKIAEMQILENALNDIKKQFSAIPQNENDTFHDPFVTLKSFIQDENQALLEKIGSVVGLPSTATNYVVMVSSLNNIVSQVELLQQQVLAAELFAPDIDKKFAVDLNAKDFFGQLKIAFRNQASDSATAAVETAMISQLENAIMGAQKFFESSCAMTQPQKQKRQSLILSPVLTSDAQALSAKTNPCRSQPIIPDNKKNRPGST
jgi:predicted O-linked N-acetylglucosamine transferase (SPINDLY family)